MCWLMSSFCIKVIEVNYLAFAFHYPKKGMMRDVSYVLNAVFYFIKKIKIKTQL